MRHGRSTSWMCSLVLVACSGGACSGGASTDAPVDLPSRAASPTSAGSAPAAEDPTPLLDQRGSLAPGPGGAAARAGYDVRVAAGDQLVVELTSSAFDPMLQVQLPGGMSMSNDDHLGSRERSLLEVVSPTDGSLKVVVTSVVPGAEGAFHLTVTRVSRSSTALARIARTQLGSRPPPAPGAPTNPAAAGSGGAVPPAAAGSGGVALPMGAGAAPAAAREPHSLPAESAGPALAFAQPARGVLDGSARLPSGEPMAAYLLPGIRAGQTFTVDLRSEQFDAYLHVVAPNGQYWWNDDFATDGAGSGLNSRLRITATVEGTYRVVASAFRSDMTGAYELVASDGDAGRGALPAAAAQVPPAAGSRVIEGRLASGAQQLASGELFDVHELTLTAGARVAIEARSTEFDTYLIVQPPSGAQLDNDDQAEGNTDAGLELVVAHSGVHRVLVTSYQAGETGRYTLEIKPLAGSGFAPAERGPAPIAGSAASALGGGRVFALLAGISDYPGDHNDLPECANDALKLSEALGRRGLSSPGEQVVLTDAQATRANVRAGVERLVRQMSENDVFIFFFSGHGGQTPAGSSRDPRELDGRDEYLVLYDGNLLDDELARLLEPVNARTTVLALDACHAGGFAKDLITRPGRIGLFSSEEDVLSSVASQFQAGGYLSHFLRTGVSGDADRDPRDGVLTVGELTHFVYREFAQHASDVRLQGAYQMLVVDRGAVPVDRVLWRYH